MSSKTLVNLKLFLIFICSDMKGTAISVLGATKLSQSSSPLAATLLALGSGIGPAIVSAAALLTTFNEALSDLLGVSRVAFAMSRAGDLPKGLAYLGPGKNPWPSVIFVGLIATIVSSFFPFESAVAVSSFGTLLYYSIINLSALRLKQNQRFYPRGLAIVDLFDELKSKMAEKEVLEKVVSENTQKASYYTSNGKGKRKEQKIEIRPKPGEVKINRKPLIFVPKWIITIKAGEHTYNRKALAASNTLIVDEIAFCTNHFTLGKIWSTRKRTSAVCEICGGAFCDDHIFMVNNT
ncbi:MAG: APC family permease [Candidatus Nitrosopolaris sp.]|jgi:hypothetical protein